MNQIQIQQFFENPENPRFDLPGFWAYDMAILPSIIASVSRAKPDRPVFSLAFPKHFTHEEKLSQLAFIELPRVLCYTRARRVLGSTQKRGWNVHFAKHCDAIFIQEDPARLSIWELRALMPGAVAFQDALNKPIGQRLEPTIGPKNPAPNVPVTYVSEFGIVHDLKTNQAVVCNWSKCTLPLQNGFSWKKR